ncbi:MAG: hypothetical protein JW966_06695 [Anaerolineae bacterium]|nr:hypothetical protein [Anaerolineae bacterium]
MRYLTATFLICVVVLSAAPPHTQAGTPAAAADRFDRLVERVRSSLTSEERVGQLMVVTFEGGTVSTNDALNVLIRDYNIGGVLLLAENDNITGNTNTPRLVQQLTTDLQKLTYEAAAATQDRDIPRSFVPLFIVTTHPGNGQPGTQIVQGTTPLPSNLALGATWNPDYARLTGTIAGYELSAMGINMLLGPSLDVLQQPQTERTLDLGVDTFGGDPYWVGKLGQAYVTGLHEGSQNRIAVFPQHFPGLGLADTQPDEEIPVVPRSVEELRRFDLIPYYAVTGAVDNTPARADGVQCANIRYQGENIRTVTRPVCIDEQAAGELFDLDYFRRWRQRGVVISSSLGSQAIRRYYNTRPFPHRQVAREAFLAGNDLLLLNDFGPTPGEDQLDNIIDVITFFAERYDSDPVFRAQVDSALTRILRLKLALYDGDISLENILTPVSDIDEVGQFESELYPIAQDSVTLIAPKRESLPPPPTRDDTIVIVTDVRMVQQCSTCPLYPLVAENELEAAVERIYGPSAGAQIDPEQVISFSAAQLESYLENNLDDLSAESSQIKTKQRIAEALRHVDWLVFVMLDVSPEVPTSLVVRRFLESEAVLVERTNVIVIALGAPVYLSSTEISKLTAYYGLYSHITPFIDAAARALFQETGFAGTLPISLPAVGYDLFEATGPEPGQTIRLVVDTINNSSVPASIAHANTLDLVVGNKLTIRTEPINDRNGHNVPDNTPVEFHLNFLNESLLTRQDAVTVDGIATTSFTPSRAGRVRITVTSLDAVTSDTLDIIIESSSETGLNTPSTTAPGDSQNTAGLPLDTSSTPGAGDEPDPTAAALLGTSEPGPPEPPAPRRTDENTGPRHLDWLDLMLSLVGLVLVSGAGFSVGIATIRTAAGGIRVGLGCIVTGLIGYIYFSLGGPGASVIAPRLEEFGPVLVTIGSGIIGLVYTWWTLRREWN